MNIILYTLFFLVLDSVLRKITLKTIKFSGLDFLFFASWMTGINYGISQGVIVSFILLIWHAFLRPSKAQYIMFSLPAQISAVALGYFFGLENFAISLIVYQFLNFVLILITGGFGMHFIIFLALNTFFNLILHNILLRFV